MSNRENSMCPDAAKPAADTASAAGGTPAASTPSSATDASPAASALAPAKITLLYESRDGRLCLFEDARGHLFAVPSALLA